MVKKALIFLCPTSFLPVVSYVSGLHGGAPAFHHHYARTEQLQPQTIIDLLNPAFQNRFLIVRTRVHTEVAVNRLSAEAVLSCGGT